MTRKIKMVKGSAEDLLEFLQKLASGSQEEVEQAFDEAIGVPCDSPVCPVCMWKHKRSPDEIAKRVHECFALLDKTELIQGLTLIYGAAAKAYDEFNGPEALELGRLLGDAIKYLRMTNEKFAFATEPNNDGEGAKH